MLRKMPKEDLAEHHFVVENMKNTDHFEYAVQMTRWLLQPMGLWPIKSSTTATVVRPITLVVSTSLLMFLFIPCCMHVFFNETRLSMRIKMVGPISFAMMSIYKFAMLLAKQPDLSMRMANMARDWHEVEDKEARCHMLESARKARVFIIICVSFMFGSGIFTSIILPLSRDAKVVGNVTYHALAYPCYFFFFDPRIRPIYDIIFFIQCAANFVKYSVACAVCSIAIICIMHICGQCSITMASLQNVTYSLDEKTLRKIVRQHMRSLKLAAKLEDMLSDICLVEMVGCTFNMVMLGYYLIIEYGDRKTATTITYSMLFVSMTFNIFIFCYIGEILTEKCEHIGEVTYMINWYKLSSKEARNIILILASTQRPVAITAGKMANLSIRCFCNVAKASMTYLNMLRTLTANLT